MRHASQAPPEPPPEQRKLPMRSRVAKVRPEKEPKPAPSIPDLWEAFDVVWDFGEPVEAEPASTHYRWTTSRDSSCGCEPFLARPRSL